MTPSDLRTGELAPNGWTQALLRGFKAGERAALTEVYRRHAEEVAGLLRHGFGFEAGGQRHRFLGYGPGAAFELQDMLHETFRRAFEPSARAAYDGIRPYGAYVTTIARNLVLRSFRAQARLFPLIEGGLEGGLDGGLDGGSEGRDAGVRAVADAGASPEREAHDASVRELVAGFLATLGPDERALVELRFTRGLSQRDAAEALGLGRQRIRTREQRLRAKLLAYLRERGEIGLIDGIERSGGAQLGMLPAVLGLPELLGWISEVTR